MRLTEAQAQELLMLVDIKLIELGYYKHGWSGDADYRLIPLLDKIKGHPNTWTGFTSFRGRLGLKGELIHKVQCALLKVTEDYLRSINEMPEA